MNKTAPRTLIVNADDCNLTAGVTRAILDCHDQGIVTSTSFLVNLAVPEGVVEELLAREKLGVGLHLNVTLGRPVAPLEAVQSLIGEDGQFDRKRIHSFKPQEVFFEYSQQMNRFHTLFGGLPTHIDSHHALHDSQPFFDVVAALAKAHDLPLRRSKQMSENVEGLCVPQHLFGNLNPLERWSEASLRQTLESLPAGISELMCHPGYVDDDLEKISSFTTGRDEEARIFKDPSCMTTLQNAGISLSHFGLCYN